MGRSRVVGVVFGIATTLLTVRAQAADPAYAESDSTSTTFSTTPVDKTVLTFTVPTTGNYLILSTAEFQNDNSSSLYNIWSFAQTTIDGTIHSKSAQFQPLNGNFSSSDNWVGYGSHQLVNLTAGSHTIKIQYYTNTSYRRAWIQNARIFAIPVATSNTSAQSPLETGVSTTSTSYVDEQTLTFTPSAAGTYVVFASADVTDQSGSVSARLIKGSPAVDQGTLQYSPPWINFPGEQWRSFTTMREYTLTSGVSQTFKIQMKTGSPRSAVQAKAWIKNARITAIPLSALVPSGSAGYGEDEGPYSTTSTIPQAATFAQVNPTTVGSYLAIGSSFIASSSTTVEAIGNLYVDTTPSGSQYVMPVVTSDYVSFFGFKRVDWETAGNHRLWVKYETLGGATASTKNARAILMPLQGCGGRPNGASCSDGNACTTIDTCSAGVCIGGAPPSCGDGNVCTDDSCNPATGCVHTNNTAPCPDANLCNGNEVCGGGTCHSGTPISCTPFDQCHSAGTCDPMSGLCSTPNVPNGTPCDDASACTQEDTCETGVCVGDDPVVCSAQDQCHEVGTCNPSDGICSNPAKSDGTSCEDGDLCTASDTCHVGACTAGAFSCDARVTSATIIGNNTYSVEAGNDKGDVVGTISAGSSCPHAFKWTHTTGVTDITAQIGPCAEAHAINNNGDVAGEAAGEAFVLTDTGITLIPGVPGSTSMAATALNDRGVAAGVARFLTESGLTHRAFRYTQDLGTEDVGTFGGASSDPASLDFGGDLYGTAQTATTPTGDPTNPGQPFLWGVFREGAPALYDISSSVLNTTTMSIRSIRGARNGRVTGLAVSSGVPGAYVYRQGVVSTIGRLPGSAYAEGLAVNNRGDVVGTSAGLAFLYTDRDGLLDLNDLLPSSEPTILSTAVAVNNARRIVARGSRQGTPVSLVVKVKPPVEPPSVDESETNPDVSAKVLDPIGFNPTHMVQSAYAADGVEAAVAPTDCAAMFDVNKYADEMPGVSRQFVWEHALPVFRFRYTAFFDGGYWAADSTGVLIGPNGLALISSHTLKHSPLVDGHMEFNVEASPSVGTNIIRHYDDFSVLFDGLASGGGQGGPDDFAVVRISGMNEDNDGFGWAQLRDTATPGTDSLLDGTFETVVLVHHPLGGDKAVSSGPGRVNVNGGIVRYFGAARNGSSGGPYFDLNGKLIGIHTFSCGCTSDRCIDGSIRASGPSIRYMKTQSSEIAALIATPAGEALRGDVFTGMNTATPLFPALQTFYDKGWASNGLFCVAGEQCRLADIDGEIIFGHRRDEAVAFTGTGFVFTAKAVTEFVASGLKYFQPDLDPFLPDTTRFLDGELAHSDFCYAPDECRLADINGDGKKDLIELGPIVYKAISTGTSFSARSFAGGVCDPTSGDKCLLGDTTGSGSDDLIRIRPGTGEVVLYPHDGAGTFSDVGLSLGSVPALPGDSYELGDIDGDHQADIVRFDHAGTVEKVVFGGANPVWSSSSCFADDVCILRDVTGDGKMDVLSFSRGTSGVVRKRRSTGTSFVGTFLGGDVSVGARLFCFGSGDEGMSCDGGAINGDAFDDIVSFVRR